MESNILIKLADDNFRVQAFAEYLERAQERYGRLMQSFADVPNYVEDRESTEPLTAEEVATIRERIKNDYSFSNCLVSLNGGYSNIDDVLDALIINCDSDINQIVQEGEQSPRDSFSDLDLINYGVCGDLESSLHINMMELSDQMQSTLHSLTCLKASVTAFMEKADGGIVDVVSRFNDIVSDVFANSHVDISNSVSFLKNKVLSITDPNEFLNSVIGFIGIKNEAEAVAESEYVPQQCDMYEYTGASPACALDFSSALSAATTIAKTAATVVRSVISGIGNMIKGLFSKLWNKFSDIVIDPNDLELFDNKGFSTIDGFRYQASGYTSFYFSNCPYTYNDVLPVWDHFIDSKVGKWIAIKTKFAEYMFKFTALTLNSEYIGINFDVCYKPRIINADVLEAAFGGTNSSTYAGCERVLENISSMGAQLYDINGTSEHDVYVSTLYGIYYERLFSANGWNQMFGYTTPNTIKTPSNLTNNVPSSVTNLDWVKLASGWDGTQFTDSSPYKVDNDYQEIAYSAQYTAATVCAAMLFEDVFPAEEAPFIPYSNNKTDFNPSSYRIKTDSQNKEAFNTFFTTAIIIAIVAIVAITSIVLLKKIARARYFKFAQRQGELDNKMWNGGKLTKAEQRRYVKAKKRCDKSSVFSSTLQQATSSSKATNDGSMSSIILAAITGTASS